MTFLNQLRTNAQISVLATVAMLVPMFVQLAQAVPVRASDQAQGWRFAVICTSLGIARQAANNTSPAQPQQNQVPNGPEKTGAFCPVCISFESVSNACLSSPNKAVFRLKQSASAKKARVFQFLRETDFNSSQSRAPPVVQIIL